mmetsp:Transcript_5184/g.11120  ORF Transcript_5184/g.11120 Transcript_5184/m.11120 type:complete len:262 (+) Transcript_5184:1055-1840(+)
MERVRGGGGAGLGVALLVRRRVELQRRPAQISAHPLVHVDRLDGCGSATRPPSRFPHLQEPVVARAYEVVAVRVEPQRSHLAILLCGLPMRFHRNVHRLLRETVNVPIGRSDVSDPIGPKSDAHDVLQHTLLTEDAFLRPQGRLVRGKLGVARVPVWLLHTLFKTKETDELLPDSNDVVGDGVVCHLKDLIVVPLIHTDAHVLKLLATRPPLVERDRTKVVFAHGRNVLPGGREGQPHDRALVVALDLAELLECAARVWLR